MTMTPTDKIHRPIRSFVLRQGRMTGMQERALVDHWPHFGVEVEGGMLDLDALFGRSAPRVLEIGFGMGDALAEMALAQPEQDYIGIEVHRPGVGRLMGRLVEQGNDNVRIFNHDAIEVLKQCIPDGSLDRVLLFFPDPWHKSRHHKRRIVQAEFIATIRSKLKPGGIFHMATDWEGYALWMMEKMAAAPGYENVAGPGNYAERPDYRVLTKFEKRGQRLGHGIWDLIFKRI